MENQVKARRLWNNKLSRIDNLMSWLYEQDILNKGEKAQKDSIFRRYYRYYNDGDFPRGVPGMVSWQRGKFNDEALEVFVENFIKKILKKYWSTMDRSKFHYHTAMEKICTVINIVDGNDVHGLINYWKKDIQDSETLRLVQKLITKYTKLKDETGNSNTSMSYLRTVMQGEDRWTNENESDWKNLVKQMTVIGNRLRMVKITLENERRLQAL